MIDKPPPFQGLKIGIPAIIPVKGRGFINQGSGLLGIAAEAFEKASHDPEPRFLPAQPPAKKDPEVSEGSKKDAETDTQNPKTPSCQPLNLEP